MLVPNFSGAGRSSTPLSLGAPLHLFKPLIQRPATVSGFSCQLISSSTVTNLGGNLGPICSQFNVFKRVQHVLIFGLSFLYIQKFSPTQPRCIDLPIRWPPCCPASFPRNRG